MVFSNEPSAPPGNEHGDYAPADESDKDKGYPPAPAPSEYQQPPPYQSYEPYHGYQSPPQGACAPEGQYGYDPYKGGYPPPPPPPPPQYGPSSDQCAVYVDPAAPFAPADPPKYDGYGNLQSPPQQHHVYVTYFAAPFLTQSEVNRYIAKVLAVLCFQLSITVAMCALFMAVQPLQDFAKQSIWLYIGMFIGTFLFLILLHVFRRKTPVNYVLMTLFTICISFSVALTVTFYTATSVLNVFCITAFIVIGIIMYVVVTKEDFTYSARLVAMITLWTIFWYCMWTFLFTPWIFNGDAYQPGAFAYTLSILGVILFTALLLFDISRIVNNCYNDGDDAVLMGSLALFLDILNLFLCLLRIFGGRK